MTELARRGGWTPTRKLERIEYPDNVCPGCNRVMSQREAAEQGMCNDCNGGAW